MKEELLLKYIQRACTVDELKEVVDWVLEDKAHRDQLFELEHLWILRDELKESSSNVDLAFERFLQINVNRNEPLKVKRKSRVLTLLPYVAICILLLLSTHLIFLLKGDNKGATLIVETPFGQNSKIILPDSTIVWMNAGSTVKYPDNYSSLEERFVILDGEAFFDVKKSSDHPFYVETQHVNVKVTGTKFNVKAYSSDKEGTVGLQSGKVEVTTSNKTQKIEMLPGQVVSFAGNRLQLDEHRNAESFFSWMSGAFYFEEERLINIIKALERKFDVEMEVVNENLKNARITCRIKENTPLQEILELLKEAKSMTYKIDGSKIIIK